MCGRAGLKTMDQVEWLDPKTLALGKRVEVNALHLAVYRHSLSWLVAGNLVGVWLAALLLWPDLNDALAPLTYGRWMPLHLNWLLYGWSALPLAGALLGFYLPEDARATSAARLALWVWSVALLFGGATWLAGQTSGKPFLDWTGIARLVWNVAGLVLWLVLFWHSRRRAETRSWSARALLALLLAVPFVLYWSAGAGVYPSVNPHSGGATGASLLGSTLAVVAIFGLLPWLLRLESTADARTRRLFGATFAISLALYAGIGHGDASHHRPDQIIGLGSLLVWVPLVWLYGRAFAWSPGSKRWLAAAFVWWLLLVVTGWIGFLPEISERVKFTNVLVAHSHLAMAGLVTSLHVVILLNLGRGRAPSGWSFWLWQSACALHVGALFWLGWREGADPALLYVRGGVADWCYGLRLLAGAAMLLASFAWLCTLGRHPDDSNQT
ncbi:MAG: hypothetical protein JWQ62_2282 [Lacunisphaera sp.]|nr:hypothetical protein [Lacunisphaera sp.]